MMEANGQHPALDPIEAALLPLREAREELIGAREEQAEQLARTNDEIKRLDRVLRAADPPTPKGKRRAAYLDSPISEELHARALAAIDADLGPEFSNAELRDLMGIADATARKAIHTMLEAGELVKVGFRSSQESGAGSKATYYTRIG